MCVCPNCETPLTEEWLREQVALTLPPVGRDDFDKPYLSWAYLDELDKLRGFRGDTGKIRHNFKNIQRFVWVVHPDNTLMVVRYKDITTREGRPSIKKRANCAYPLPYLPTEICDWQGHRIGSLKEEYVSYRQGLGPPVEPTQPKTLSLDYGLDELESTSWQGLTDPEQGDRRLHEMTPLRLVELKEAYTNRRYRSVPTALHINLRDAEQPHLKPKRLPRTKSEAYVLGVLTRIRRLPGKPNVITSLRVNRRRAPRRHVLTFI